MVPLSADELRARFLKFFAERGHVVIPSASLIPENDPTVLFTTAGMHPLVPYLLGEPHPQGKRLVNVQKCIRTGDIDEVGDNRHLTFFEMLGNWSLGDYFKANAIQWSFEFLTDAQWLNIPLEKLAITVFAGDESTPRDDESAEHWLRLGIPNTRIAYLGKDDNWWPAGGKHHGPQGPDTEMFYWTGDTKAPDVFNPKDEHWVEIWNDVFMQFNKNAEGILVPLVSKNVDTGMGLERTLAILNGKKTVFDTDLFKTPLRILTKLSGRSYGQDESTMKSMRVVADHLRTATFILGDQRGVVPSNVDQGYILRRLIRRAIRHARLLGITGEICWAIAEQYITEYRNAYPELEGHRARIETELVQEEVKFASTLQKGIRAFERMLGEVGDNTLSGEQAFTLFSTYGFPLELTKELLSEQGKPVDEEKFKEEFVHHQELSRAGAAQKFAGGLVDHSKESTMLHTATHLLHKALREVLGDHVAQRGSNITRERLRFDFTQPRKLTADELKRVEDIVNTQIQRALPVHFEVLDVEEAKRKGAIGLFEDKYAQLGNKIKVYFVGDYSAEICGGPHVENTGELGSFTIIKEEAVASGVRRIKAIIGPNPRSNA